MANQKPIKLDTSNGVWTRFQTGDTVEVAHGGTGAATAAGARTNLGLTIGSDIQAHGAALDAISALSSNGFAVRNGTDWYTRSLNGVAGRVTVSNSNGSGGDVTIDLATVSNSNTGSFSKLIVDSYGRVTGTTPVVASDISSLVDSRYIRKDAVTVLDSGVTIRYNGSTTLSNPQDLATVQYVQDIASGGNAPWNEVALVTTTNITLSGIQNLQGETGSAGMRVLVAGQTDQKTNGIYVMASGSWTRATDADATDEFTPGRIVFCTDGDYLGSQWSYNGAASPTIGTTNLTFSQTGSGAVSVGGGLVKSGSTISVGTASSSRIVVNANDIDLATVGNSNSGTFLKLTVDSYGRVTGTTAVVSSDVSSLLDSYLTAVANLTTTGLITRTATGTATTCEIQGTAGRVTVTNGTGVSGNPVIDLASSGVSPGTYNSVTVDAYGRVTGGTSTPDKLNVSSFQNGEASSIAICRLVYSSGDGIVKLANGNSETTCDAVGFVAQTSIAASASGNIANSGFMEATTNQWDTVTGQSGGLTPGARYYMSVSNAGSITSTVPASGFVKQVGIAMSATTLSIQFGQLLRL